MYSLSLRDLDVNTQYTALKIAWNVQLIYMCKFSLTSYQCKVVKYCSELLGKKKKKKKKKNIYYLACLV